MQLTRILLLIATLALQRDYGELLCGPVEFSSNNNFFNSIPLYRPQHRKINPVVCVQQRFRSACTSILSEQSKHLPLRMDLALNMMYSPSARQKNLIWLYVWIFLSSVFKIIQDTSWFTEWCTFTVFGFFQGELWNDICSVSKEWLPIWESSTLWRPKCKF